MNLWSAGAYTLNCYASNNNSITDKYYFLCDDIIHDMVVTSISPKSQSDSIVVLACNDSTVKVISDQGKLQYEAVLDSAPISLSQIKSQDSTIICYGLSNGNIGAIELGQDEAIVLWEV